MATNASEPTGGAAEPTGARKPANKHRLTRRGLFTLGGGVAAAGVVGGGIAAFSAGGADAAQPGTAIGTATARPEAFVHPGMLHNAGDLHRAKVRIAAHKDPWLKGWTRLTNNPHSASTWQPRPQAVVVRGGTGQNLAQWQESGRDQGHTMMGMGLMGAICEMAWNQGVDLYGYLDNRFMKSAEYVAKYNLGAAVPFTTYTWRSGQGAGRSMEQPVISDIARGTVRPVWEILHNHYARRRRLTTPFITLMAEKVRAEGGGGDYGPNSGGYDQLGFGTLLYSK